MMKMKMINAFIKRQTYDRAKLEVTTPELVETTQFALSWTLRLSVIVSICVGALFIGNWLIKYERRRNIKISPLVKRIVLKTIETREKCIQTDKISSKEIGISTFASPHSIDLKECNENQVNENEPQENTKTSSECPCAKETSSPTPDPSVLKKVEGKIADIEKEDKKYIEIKSIHNRPSKYTPRRKSTYVDKINSMKSNEQKLPANCENLKPVVHSFLRKGEGKMMSFPKVQKSILQTSCPTYSWKRKATVLKAPVLLVESENVENTEVKLPNTQIQKDLYRGAVQSKIPPEDLEDIEGKLPDCSIKSNLEREVITEKSSLSHKIYTGNLPKSQVSQCGLITSKGPITAEKLQNAKNINQISLN